MEPSSLAPLRPGLKGLSAMRISRGTLRLPRVPHCHSFLDCSALAFYANTHVKMTRSGAPLEALPSTLAEMLQNVPGLVDNMWGAAVTGISRAS
jgi:hypothetical protein